MHYQVAEDHGYTAIADVDIMDEEGSMTLPVEGGDNLTENYVGSHFADYDYYVVPFISKVMLWQDMAGPLKTSLSVLPLPRVNPISISGGTGGRYVGAAIRMLSLESMAEAGKSVVDYLDGNILYINVMNRLSVDCDCDGNPAEPDMHDIGILASFDPGSRTRRVGSGLCRRGREAPLVNRIESRNGLHTLEQGRRSALEAESIAGRH